MEINQQHLTHFIAATVAPALRPYEADYDVRAIATEMVEDATPWSLTIKPEFRVVPGRLPERFWEIARAHAVVDHPRRPADTSGRRVAGPDFVETEITERARRVAAKRSGRPIDVEIWDESDEPTYMESTSYVSPREVQDVIDGIAHADASGHKRMSPEWAASYRGYIWITQARREPLRRTDEALKDASRTADAVTPRRDTPEWRAAYEARLVELDAITPPEPDLHLSEHSIPLPWTSIMDGGELQATRESLGLTAERLGVLIGNPATGKPVRPDTILKWERGEAQIPARVQRQVARIVRDTDAAVEQLVVELRQQRHPVAAVYRTDAEFADAVPAHADKGARWWRHVAARAAREVTDARVETQPRAATRA